MRRLPTSGAADRTIDSAVVMLATVSILSLLT